MTHAYTSRSLVPVVIGVCCLVMTACGQPNQPDVSAVKHDLDQPTRGTDSWMWYGVNSTQYDEAVAPLAGVDPAELLADDHALVEKTQFWLDKLDAQIRAAHPADLANVPKPQAKVVRDSSANAFVAPVGVCFDVKVKMGSGHVATGDVADKAYFDLSTGEVSAYPDELPCLEGPAAVATVKAIAKRFNAHTSSACRLDYDAGQRAVTFSSACDVNDDLGGAKAAKQFVVLETANYVTIHTGLFPLMTESEFVAVLAHELGHYYRSHMTAQDSEFDFFYTLDRDQAARRPVADASKKELGQGAIASATLLSSSDMHFTYANQKLRSELFFAAGSLIKASCRAGECSTSCKDVKTLIDSQSFKAKISTFPFGQNSTAQNGAVNDFETKALACLATMDLSSHAGTLTATSASWDVIAKAVSAPTWPSWLSTLPASTQQAVGGVLQLDALRLGTKAPSGSDLKTIFMSASKTLAKQDDASIDTLKMAMTEHLGQYTAEQEADEESAEWISAIGVAASSSVEAMHSLNQGSETGMRGFTLGADDCDALWNNKWLDKDGNYFFVPVGDYAEVHHSTCYRMFNLEREISAHRYETAPVELPSMDGAAWKSLQDTADRLGQSPKAPQAFTGLRESRVAKIARKGNMATCSYSSSYR